MNLLGMIYTFYLPSTERNINLITLISPMSKKGAIELSMSTLVIVIISLVVLGLGVKLLYSFVSSGEQLKGQLDEQTEAELQRLLVDQGKQVALPLHQATLAGGESHVFGIGILNIGGVGDSFKLQVDLSQMIDPQQVPITTSNSQRQYILSWLIYNNEDMVIKESEHRSEPILVNIPNDAAKGIYIFDAKILAQNNLYGNVQKFYVTVQ